MPVGLVKFFSYGIICLCFCAQEMWWIVERLIMQFNHDHQSSLKWGGTRRILIGQQFILKCFNLSRWYEVIMAEIKNAWWTLMDAWRHFRHWFPIRQMRSRDNFSSRATWDSIFNQTDETSWQRFTSKCFIWVVDSRWRTESNGHTQFSLKIHIFFDDVNHLRVFQEIELFRYLNPWISCFPSLLDQFQRQY